MKTIKYFSGLLFLFLLTSCSEKFLEIKPNLTTTSLTYFKTERDFLEALNGIYSTLQTQLPTFVIMTEVRSDNTCVYFNPSERAGVVQLEEIDEFRDGAINTSSNYWDPAYDAIYRINLLLSKIEEGTFSTAGIKERIIGETKFLRAFYYFNLVRFYGDIPLILEPIEDLAKAYAIKRTNTNEIYLQIQKDVNDAILFLPENYSPSDIGRVTKGAALTLLAKVQMTEKKYSEAIKTLRQIVSLGYKLENNYKNCFDPKYKNNAESIFEIQYNSSIDGMSNNNIFSWVPIGSEAYYGIFGYVGSNRTGWNIPTKDLISTYELNDLRKDISIKSGYENSEGLDINSPYINKWIYDAGIVNRNDCNFPIYRYADVLLMLSEALNEIAFQGGGEAFHLLNMVRERAGLSPKTSSDIISQQAFRLAIEKERRVELAFEGHRWFDLVRTERALDVIKAYGNIEKANPSTPRGFGEEYLSDAFNIQQFRLLYPIPQKEIDKVPRALTQNSGY